jgi:hypothetical protein
VKSKDAKLRRTVRIFSLILFLLPIGGCERVWNLLILKQYQPRLVFCLTNGSATCSGDGVQMNGGIDIARVGPSGDDIQKVWSIEGDGTRDNRVRVLEYGVPPIGWKSTTAEGKILDNQYYSFNDQFYFIKDAKGNFNVLSFGTFWTGVESRKRGPARAKVKDDIRII